MQTQSLDGFWQVRQVNTQKWLPAQVPGGVHTDLMAAGQILDPFYGTNEEKAQWVAKKHWEYRRFFYPLPAVLKEEKVWLVCDGLDTLAEVRLNGRLLGQANNMFRSWRWEVKEYLREGENRLEILFRSPLSYIKNRERTRRLKDMNMGIRGGPHLRKTPSHFGWDWGPRLPCMGIWQPVRLEGRSRGKLGDIRIDQEHTAGLVTLTARVQCDLWLPGDERYTVRLRITGPEQQVWQLDAPARPQSVMTVTITNPQLWWPNGYGTQPLYTTEVELRTNEDELLDRHSGTIGLRTVALRQEDDDYGKSFTLLVNGVPVFCKGANWIPADAFPTRVTPERLENLIRAAAEANHNMLRVWGGGYYESEAFYDLCDRYGILVWQDFQFACAIYPLDDPAYADNARCEAVENVRRLRQHASLALWCGNNEIEWLGGRFGWWKNNAAREAYQRFFFQDLPALLAEEDPQRPYWPGSPSSNEPFQDPSGERAGDAHLWEVYHEFRLPVFYRKQNPRFASEFGFQALPAHTTIEQFCPPEQRKLNSPVMRLHQRAMAGNPKLIWYLAQRFRLPRSFTGLAALTQIYQAEAVRTAVEHWRRQPERTSGALYWQLNDCWPVISWSSIDYYGRWKALHYAARRFYAPVLLSIEDITEKRQRRMNVWVSNDSCAPWQGHLRWSLETLDGEVLEGGNQPVSSAAQSAQCQLKLDFTHQNGKADWRRTVLVTELWQEPTRLALQVAAFLPEKDMHLEDPQLRAEIQPDGRLRVTAKKLARFVELSFEGADIVLSDNYFDLPAGRAVLVDFPLPNGWTLEQAQDRLLARSLYDAGPFDSLIASHWKGDMAFLQTIGGMLWEGLLLPAWRARK